MIFLADSQAGQQLIEVPSLWTLVVLTILGLLNLYLLKRLRSVDLIEKNAQNWRQLYESEEQKAAAYKEERDNLKLEIVELRGKIDTLTAQVESLKHMPDFQKIYTEIIEHRKETKEEWEKVQRFLQNNVRVVEINDRRAPLEGGHEVG